jgi:hypothetical protein
MTSRLARLALAAALAAHRLALAKWTCSYFDSHMGATFDLSELYRDPDQPMYIVEDGDLPCTTVVEKNYTYYFNICGTVSSYPFACATLPTIGSISALQIDKRYTQEPSDDWCYMVGSYSETNTEISLIDADDPTKGINLQYLGDICQSNHKNRYVLML